MVTAGDAKIMSQGMSYECASVPRGTLHCSEVAQLELGRL